MHFYTLRLFFSVILGDDLCSNKLIVKRPFCSNLKVEIVRSAGYPVETHRTVTADGYLIVLHRIPRPRPARVVIYFHGLFGGSIDIVIRGPKTGLAFILSRAGFDVWLPNLRGSTEEPLTVNSTKKNPWDFSWDDNARYDFPAIMDYVLSTTGASKVSTVGLSMAANYELGGLVSHPRLNRRISVMVFLAPTARLKHITSMIGRGAPHWRTFEKLVQELRVNRVPFFDPGLFHRILSWLCCLPRIGVIICSSIMFTTENIVFEIKADLVPRLFKYYPHPTTTKSIIHYLQIMNSGKFCPFDYGSGEENMKRYSQTTPPDYDLSKVTAPTAIFYSRYDTMANFKDAEWLASQLNNTVLTYSVPKRKFAHLSFMWEPNIKNLLYNKVLDVLFKHW